MTKTQFTQGPWITAKADRAIGIFSNGNATFFVAKAYGPDRAKNAHLIASAPELYEALEEIIDMNVQYAVDRYGDASKAEDMACVRVARAAISKARGET